MITPAYAQTMARYNQWQNSSLYRAAGGLSASELTLPRGAFFGSIQATLGHLMWWDQIWLRRLDPNVPAPRAAANVTGHLAYPDWDDLVRERVAFDAVIIDWAGRLAPADVTGNLEYFSGAAQRQVTLPRGLAIMHMFNHQTHHRGQVHCMLTQAGAKPDDTDLPLTPGARPAA